MHSVIKERDNYREKGTKVKMWQIKLRFYRAMLCIRGTSHGPVSIRLSVTSRCSIETAERIELIFGM